MRSISRVGFGGEFGLSEKRARCVVLKVNSEVSDRRNGVEQESKDVPLA